MIHAQKSPWWHTEIWKILFDQLKNEEKWDKNKIGKEAMKEARNLWEEKGANNYSATNSTMANCKTINPKVW